MFKLVVGRVFAFVVEAGVVSLRVGTQEVWWSTSQGWDWS
jgi:hypothetical protein